MNVMGIQCQEKPLGGVAFILDSEENQSDFPIPVVLGCNHQAHNNYIETRSEVGKDVKVNKDADDECAKKNEQSDTDSEIGGLAPDHGNAFILIPAAYGLLEFLIAFLINEKRSKHNTPKRKAHELAVPITAEEQGMQRGSKQINDQRQQEYKKIIPFEIIFHGDPPRR